MITLKAWNTLNAVDVIFCPGTKSGEGRMKSRALDILRQLEVDETKIRLFQVPMSRDRQEALCAYDRVCGEVLELVRSGKSVGITAEGDACFYYSAHLQAPAAGRSRYHGSGYKAALQKASWLSQCSMALSSVEIRD